MPPSSGSATPRSASSTPYNVDKAKAEALLTQAGLSKKDGKWMLANGQPFTFKLQVPNGFSDWVAAGKNIANQLTNAGIAVEATTSADYAVYQKEIAEGKYAAGFWLIALGPSTYNAYARLYGARQRLDSLRRQADPQRPGRERQLDRQRGNRDRHRAGHAQPGRADLPAQPAAGGPVQGHHHQAGALHQRAAADDPDVELRERAVHQHHALRELSRPTTASACG